MLSWIVRKLISFHRRKIILKWLTKFFDLAPEISMIPGRFMFIAMKPICVTTYEFAIARDQETHLLAGDSLFMNVPDDFINWSMTVRQEEVILESVKDTETPSEPIQGTT